MLHSFGIKLVYPGSIQLLQASISLPLQDGRAQWVMEKSGCRTKILASDGNHIDTMFFDRRATNTKNGTTLVISSDGNAGFYEIGVLVTPLESGYSVLGWNHPGFGGSSGAPFPQSEANAADAVMQFAVEKLGFRPEQIILHGWSIGGFTTSCLAMNYPEVKGVVRTFLIHTTYSISRNVHVLTRSLMHHLTNCYHWLCLGCHKCWSLL
jgi:hypothetical protein